VVGASREARPGMHLELRGLNLMEPGPGAATQNDNTLPYYYYWESGSRMNSKVCVITDY
jgi:hypothetical protein